MTAVDPAPPRDRLDPAGDQRWPDVLMLWIPFAVGAIVTFAISPDDALITARYAWNLMSGNGLVFNTGEPVEGFSSPAGLLLIAPLTLLPEQAVLVALKFASLALATGALIVGRRLLWMTDQPRILRLAGLFFMGSSPVVVFAASNGLETALAMASITLLVYLLASEQHLRFPVVVGLVAALCIWTRPELAVIVVALVVTTGLVARGARQAFQWSVPAIVGAALLLLARWWYFGSLLPNTYFAKDRPLLDAARSGAVYVAASVQPGASLPEPTASPRAVLGLILLSTVAVGFAAGVWWMFRQRQALLVLPVAAFVQVAVTIVTGGDWMAMGRFLAPSFIPLAATVVVGLGCLTDAVASRYSPAHAVRHVVRSAPVVLLFAVSTGAWVPAPAWNSDSDPAVPIAPIWNTGWDLSTTSLMRQGRDESVWTASLGLFDCAGPGDSVAYSEIGFAPWVRRDLRFFDMYGLTDASIAQGYPSTMKESAGVVEPRWFDPSTVMGEEIIEENPVVINKLLFSTLEEVPTEILGAGIGTEVR